VSAVGIESALKRQTKYLTEHSWQIRALQVYGSQETDFRNHFLPEAGQLTLCPNLPDARMRSKEHPLTKSTDYAPENSTKPQKSAPNLKTN